MAAEYRNLNLDSCSEFDGVEEKMGVQKITVSDNVNGFHCPAGKSDSVLIDMENISICSTKDLHGNSAITRSLSRKGSQHDRNESKYMSNMVVHDREPAGSSPSKGTATPDNAMTLGDGTTNNLSKSQIHQDISITGNIRSSAENKMCIRRNSFRRPSASWFFDPKRILLLFASLSSMGTIILIYCTLTISHPDSETNSFN